MVLFVYTRQSLKRERQQSRETKPNFDTTDTGSTDEFPCTLCICQCGSEESLRIHTKTEQWTWQQTKIFL